MQLYNVKKCSQKTPCLQLQNLYFTLCPENFSPGQCMWGKWWPLGFPSVSFLMDGWGLYCKIHAKYGGLLLQKTWGFAKCNLISVIFLFGKNFKTIFFFKGFSVINGSLAFTNCMQPDLRTRKISILKYYAMMSTKFDFGSIARVS